MSQKRPDAIALISGGKDSLLALYHAIANGYNIVALGNLHPPTTPFTDYATDDAGTTIYTPSPASSSSCSLGPAARNSDELDSYMYQTIGHTLLPLYATCLNLPLYRRAITGASVNTHLNYAAQAGDETEDLTALLRSVLRHHPNVVAVASGAILSTYQRTRIESVCARLGLESLAYLWQMAQEDVLGQLTTLRVDARIVKVAALGLDREWLWLNVAEPKVQARLAVLKERWGINPAGEGGEYETLVVNAPGWQGRIEVREEERIVVEEAGGAAWVRFAEARVVMREDVGMGLHEAAETLVRRDVLGPRFAKLLDSLPEPTTTASSSCLSPPPPSPSSSQHPPPPLKTATTISNILSPLPCDSLTAEVLNIFALLTSLLSPLPLSAVTSTTLLLRDMSDFAAVNSLYAPFFPLPLPPSRVCVAVPLPADRNAMLHVSYCPPAASSPRKGLHVQSRSHWAPANIGPYSQAVLNTSTQKWEVAGQIPLFPASMTLERAGARQAALALQHLHRVWRAVGAVPQAAVAWVVEDGMVPVALEAWNGYGVGVGGAVMVAKAVALPRGAGVEWVGFGTEGEGEGSVEIRYDDEEIEEGTVFSAAVTKGKRWVPVCGVWDDQGRRRECGVVVVRGAGGES